MRARNRLGPGLLWLACGVALVAVGQANGHRFLQFAAAHEVELAAPGRLWWALLAWLVPLASLWSLTDLPRWQQGLQVAVRVALVALLVLALTGPRTRREQPRGLHVIHLVDRSESVPSESIRQAARRIRDTHQAAAGFADLRTDVIAFDSVARRLPWPPTPTEDSQGAPLPAPAVTRQPATGRGTDLAAAMNLALGLMDTERVGHVVLWTDGIETAGDALSLTEPFASAGVRVHLPRRDADAALFSELIVEALDVPTGLRSGIPFPLVASVRATAPMAVRCAVAGGAHPPEAVTRDLRPGVTRVQLGQLRFGKGGHHDISVQCTAAEGADRFPDNNTMRARVSVAERPRLLYLEGARGQSQYLGRALSDDFQLEVRDATGLPRQVAAMKVYNAIILSDVARSSQAGVTQLSEGDMRNLDEYVKQGGGLLVIGGQDSLGSGGYQGTWFDKEVLPVRMEVESRVEMPSIAMMLLIDRSGSMSGKKIALAKEAARATAEALGAEDRIGIIAFDNIARPLVRLQRAGNRYRIATQIDKLSASGGTHIYPALQQAQAALAGVQARVKHVILLSDGQAPRQGIDGLVRSMRAAGVTVSTVGVGDEVDRSLIESIADRGGGRFYFTDRPETLPRIFVRETKQIAGKSVIETKVRARLAPRVGRVDLLRGVDIRSSPVLYGYLPTRTKPGAEEILRLSSGAPLLVRWQRGLGRVSVWTSDLKNRWAHAWIDWPDYARLSRQLVRDLMQEEVGSIVPVQLSRERSRLRIAVDAIDETDAYMRDLHGALQLTLPGGETRRLPLPEVAMGRYETTVAMDRFGPYEVHVALRRAPDKPPVATGAATAVHPYPDEFRSFDASATSLPDLVSATGGSASAGPEHWLARAGATHKKWLWLWPDLIWLALGLLLLDVALRRIRLGRAQAATWFAAR